MLPHSIRLQAVLSIALTFFTVNAQSRKAPHGAIAAIVVDERLSVLRSRPELDGPFIRRLPRGKLVEIKRTTRIPNGETFNFVNVSSRTHGWILSQAVVSPLRLNDDERLLNLIPGFE